MEGIKIEPIAATSATALPEISAKKSETITLTIANPPLTKPTNAVTKAISLLEIELVFISDPASINKGIAINGNLVEPSKSFRAAS